METSTCVFCKIVDGLIPAEIIAQNDSCIVIQDRAPRAPVHLLVLSKKHVPQISFLNSSRDPLLMNELVCMVQDVARAKKIDDFRLVINNGAGAGQTVFHLHVHFLAGESIPAMMSQEL